MNLVRILLVFQQSCSKYPPAGYPFSIDSYRELIYAEIRNNLLEEGNDLYELD